MAALFNRVCVVEFGLPGQNGKAFSDLKVTFSVKKGRVTGSTPNHSTITIYNLAKDSVSTLNEPNAVVRLFAGYESPVLIFEGNPIPNGVKTDKQGPDRITRIEAMDGWFALQTRRIRINSAANVSLSGLLDEVADQLGIPVGVIQLPDGANVIGNPSGFSTSGLSAPLLDQIAISLECEWWIDSGRLNLVQRGRPTSDEAVFIAADTGSLIGSPEKKTLIGSASKSNDGTETTCLLNPAITPGRLIQVESDQVKGVFIAQQVEHTGDSRAGPWYTKTLGIPYSTANTPVRRRA